MASTPARITKTICTWASEMRQKVRYQLFLDPALSDRFEALAARPGVTKSSLLADALEALINRRARTELEELFGARLDSTTAALVRLERNSHVLIETLALFVRYELAIHPPLAENDQAGRALARQRFEAFIEQVGRQLTSGKRSLDLRADGR